MIISKPQVVILRAIEETGAKTKLELRELVDLPVGTFYTTIYRMIESNLITHKFKITKNGERLLRTAEVAGV